MTSTGQHATPRSSERSRRPNSPTPRARTPQTATCAPRVAGPAPGSGTALPPAGVLQLQRLAGNRAVTDMLERPVQHESRDTPQAPPPEPVAADAIVDQHGAAVAMLEEKVERTVGQTDEDEAAPELASEETVAQLPGLLAEVDAQYARIAADVQQLVAAPTHFTGTSPAHTRHVGASAQWNPLGAQTATPSIQRVKTTKHDRNYFKRTRKLSAKLKKSKLVIGGAEYADFRKARRKAKAYARKLDKNRSASQLMYQAYTAKKTGAVHPTWNILVHATKMYKYLDRMNVTKERVRWFQHKAPTGFTRRSMRAALQPGAKNLMVGSNRSGTHDLYWGEPTLSARKGSSGSALYIKGHLLNDHLGGGGLAHNLVPLTADKQRGAKNKTGSNDANGEHNKQIEEPIKKLLTGKTQIKETLKYRVDSLAPDPDATRVTNTQLVRKYAHAFDAAAKLPANSSLTTGEVRDAIETADASLDGIGKHLLAAIGTGHLKSPSAAASLLLDNATLWEAENAVIPGGIECSATYSDGVTVTTPLTKSGHPMRKFEIRNVLPTKFTAPYRP